MLGPHITQQVSADWAGARLHIVAVFFIQFGAGEAVQLFIKRLHLRPQTLHFSFHLFRCHVVAGQPHLIEAFEAKLICAFIGDLDHAGIIVLHRHGDRAPAFPDSFEFFRVAAGFNDRRQLVEVQCLALIGEFPGAVGRVEIGGDLRKLLGCARRRRGRDRDPGTQHGHLARQISWQDADIELLGLIRE